MTLLLKYATVRGYAGDQPTKGYYRKTGDSLIWNPKGGPTASVSVSIGTKVISVSAGLGFGGTSGVGTAFRVPSNGNWKIYTQKKYKVTQTHMWGHPVGSPAGTWVKVDTKPTSSFYQDLTKLVKQ